MRYIPRKNQSIEAYKFTGKITEELKELGLKEMSKNRVFSCNCGQPVDKHAYIANNMKSMFSFEQIICPNSYVIFENNQIVNIMSDKNFEEIYKPLYSESILDAEIIEEEENAN